MCIRDSLKTEDLESLKKGFGNMDRHVENLRKFGQSVVVCINRFPTDTDKEIALIREHCEQNNLQFAVNTAFGEGGKGAVELAKVVVDTIDNNPSKPLQFLYDNDMSIKEKVDAVSYTHLVHSPLYCLLGETFLDFIVVEKRWEYVSLGIAL